MIARDFVDQNLEEAGHPGAGQPDWEGGWPQSSGPFASLVDMLQGRLYRYAYRRLGNIQDAEDVVQDVFIQAYTERERRRKVVHVRAYLYCMTANACKRLLRRKSQGALPLEDSAAANIHDLSPLPSSVAAMAEEMQRVSRLLPRLPEPQAETIRLRFFDELRFVEIAEVMGTSVSTVKSRLRYGLERLQQLIREEV